MYYVLLTYHYSVVFLALLTCCRWAHPRSQRSSSCEKT